MMKRKPKPSEDHSNSESGKSEEFKKFEQLSNQIGSLTRKELDTIFKKEKKEKPKGKQKTRRN